MGKFIVEELQKKAQFDITALTRADSTNPVPQGVHVVTVDYDKHETLVAALQGQQVLICTLATSAPKDQQDKLANAAVEAGVSWFLPNDWGYHVEDEQVARDNLVSATKIEERSRIEKKGLAWISISCGFWYEYSLAGGLPLFGIDAVDKKANLYGGGQVALSTSTWSQTGRAVAALLSLPQYPEDDRDDSVTISRWTNKFVHVHSYTLNQRQMLDVVQKVTATTDEDWTIETPTAKSTWERGMAMLKGGDMIGFAIALYSRMFFDEQPGNLVKQFGLDNELLGLPTEDLEESTKKAVQMAEEQYIPKRFAAIFKQHENGQ